MNTDPMSFGYMLNTSSEKDDYGEQAKEEAEEEEAHPWSTHYQFPSQPSFFEQNLSIRTQHSPISERRSSTSSTSYSSGMYTECERSSPILSAPHIYNSNVSPPSLPSLRSVLSSSSVTYLLPLDQNNKLPPLQSDFPQSAVPGDSHTTNQDNQWREHQQRLEAEFSNTLSLREHKLRRSRARCGGPLPRSKTRIQGQSTRYPTLSPTIPAGPRRSRVDIPPPKRKPIHSNKAYTREQVHWTRCMKVDCDRKFEEMTLMWAKQFPGERGGGGGGGEEKISHQSLSSRTYRDNVIPLFNLRELIIRDRNGRIVMQPCKIRKDSSTPAEVMHSLAGRHPDMALHYDWVPEHVKATARAIIAEDEADPESKGAIIRRLLREWNQAILNKENKQVDQSNATSFAIVQDHRCKNFRSRALCEVSPHRLIIPCDCPEDIRALTSMHLPTCASEPTKPCRKEDGY